MPRRKQQKDDDEIDEEVVLADDSDTETELGDVDNDDGDAEGDDDIEDPIEGEDEDELDTEEQAMTVAQQLLMRKKQAVMSQADVYRTYYTKSKQTEPFITKFEKAKIISVRAQAIESGATPFVPIDDPNEDPYSIAKREYDTKRIPYFIVRTLPDQEKEYWRLTDFKSLVPLTSM